MRKLVGILLVILVGLRVGTTLGTAGPVPMPEATRYQIEAQSTKRLEPVRFLGGQRACVIAVGDHNPIVPLTVEIFDSEGNLVTRDSPGEFLPPGTPGSDLCAAIWYPPRAGDYVIQVTNHGLDYNLIWVAVR